MAEPTTIHSLPEDVYSIIFQMLPTETAAGLFDLSAIGRVSQVCRAWQAFVLKFSQPLYLSFYQRHFSALEMNAGLLIYKKTYQELKNLDTFEQRLVFSAYKGCELLLSRLMRRGADNNHAITCIEPGVQTPEMSYSQVEVVKTYSFNIDNRPHTALTAAISGCHIACVEILLKEGDVDCNRPNLKKGVTALSYAFACSLSSSKKGIQEMIALLLKVEKLEVKNNFATIIWNEHKFQKSPIKSLACLQWIPELKKINPDLDLNPFLKMITACEGNREVALLLKESTVNINAAGKNRNTSLHHISLKGHFETLIAFLAFPGVDPYLENDDGKTALDLLLENKKFLHADPKSIEIIVSAFFNHPRTALVHIWKFAKYFFEQDLDPIRAPIQRSLLAAFQKKIENPNIRDENKNGILHYACYWGFEGLIRFLLANPNLFPSVKNSAQETAWQLLSGNSAFSIWDLKVIEAITRQFLNHPNTDVVMIWEVSIYFNQRKEREFENLRNFISDTMVNACYDPNATIESPGPSPSKKPRK